MNQNMQNIQYNLPQNTFLWLYIISCFTTDIVNVQKSVLAIWKIMSVFAKRF